MSSHREAPEISKDPVADNADVYAFVSPDDPSTVTIISNFVPLQEPAGGPNFYEFGDDVIYSLYIDNDGDGKPEISYVFNFHTTVRDGNTFLYNTGPISSIIDPNWNRRQFYSVTRVEGDDTTIYGTAAANPPPAKHGKHHKHHHPKPKLKTKVLARGLACPPCNIGPHSIPNYAPLEAQAIHSVGSVKVFAGQRREGFYVDLGAVFDLADLRPFQSAFSVPPALASGPGVDTTKALNIHSIAIQIPISELTAHGRVPSSSTDPHAVIGVWSAASRRKVRMLDSSNDEKHQSGPWVQVSRLGNPLINEVVIPLSHKDKWNGQYPAADKQFAKYYAHPELAKLLPGLYHGVFPNLGSYAKPRADLEAILLTGIPAGVIKAAPGFTTFTGSVLADQLRLNVAIPPTTSTPSRFGLLGGDLAGYPNGRRVSDDVVAIELRAIAGATIPLVDSTYTADGAASAIQQWQPGQYATVPGPNRYISSFPYLGTPLDGFDNPSS